MSGFSVFSKSYNYTKDYKEGLSYIIQELKNEDLKNKVADIKTKLMGKDNKTPIDLKTVITRLCALKEYDEFKGIMQNMKGFRLKDTYDESCLHEINKSRSHRRGGKSKKRTNKKKRHTRRRKV